MNKRSEAQQARRERERGESHAGNQAAKAAEAMAARSPDGPVEFEPDSNATADAFQRAPEEPREFKRGNPDRTAAYDQMMADRADRSKRESEQIHEAQRPEPAPEPAAPAAEVPTPAPEPAPALVPAVPETVDVKIDGQVMSVPKDEVEEYGGVRQYQMFKAMEKRLEEAKRYNVDAAKLFQQAQTAQKPPEPVRKPEEVIRDAVAKIQFGAPDEAAQAFMEAHSALVPKQADPQAIAMQAYLLSRVTEAENKFVAENKDLIDNPMLKQLIIGEKDRRLMAYRQQNRLPDDWNSFYNQIALDVRTAIGRPTIAPPVVPPASQPISGLAEKEARKASIVALPTAATRAAAPEAEKPMTRNDLLARARQLRGQPV